MSQDPKLYLEHLNDLGQEIRVAMLAISEGSLSALEESLWKQQVLCVSLNRVLMMFHSGEVDPDAIHCMQDATEALHILNRIYAELIRQSRESSDLLLGLCSSYTEHRDLPFPSQSGQYCSMEA